jgi:hypothetical protein
MTPSVARCVLAMTSVVSLALGCGGGGGAGVDAPGLDAPCAAAEPVRDVPYQALPGVAPALQALDLYPPCASGAARSKRSRFMTLVQAASEVLDELLLASAAA